ncbi:MAG: PAS domain-containing protein [Planctomycetota bacterium]|nr:PAS domain-containing protein [Planctomycetota bacterium]
MENPTVEQLKKENEKLRRELAIITERLELSLSAGNLAWWDWDVSENKVTFNELKVKMLGYEMADFRDVGYQAFTDLLHPDDYEPAMQAMRDHLSGKKKLYEVEYRIKTSSGEYKWFYDRGSVTDYDEDGKPTRLKGIVFDITSRKRAEMVREQLIEQLKKSLKEVRTLRGIVPICASCKKIKEDDGYWKAVEEYVTEHSEAMFSHGLCPECASRYMNDNTAD